MKDGLARLEAHLERLVEGTLTRLLAGRLHPREVIVALGRAMEDGAYTAEGGEYPAGGHEYPLGGHERRAPDRYLVRLNPADAAALESAEAGIEAALAEELVHQAREAGLSLARAPIIHLIADSEVPPRQVRVEVETAASEGDTSAMTPASGLPPTADAAPAGFLIVDGERHVPLSKPVISLGRRLDNDIVLDDPRVSRHHAQIRQRYGKWVLYDLNSRAGTQVNDQPVAECVLRPGDVIALAGATLIYGEDPPAQEAEAEG